MNRTQFFALPLIIAGLLLAAAICWAAEFNVFGLMRDEAHQFAREIGGRP